ncbi:MAG: glycosyltransferase family 2 protein, partial [Anaerolineae bacterium]|nr:glycosyltransferase family 2 protein [Anaerolineae bacterium]
MAAPRVSIILPTHNRPETLVYALHSVLAQTERDFELFVVGDGCTDHTGDVVSQFAAQDDRVRWLDLPKALGYGYANRNIALRQARAPYIAYLAHDDVWTPDHLELLCSALEAHQAELVHGQVWNVSETAVIRTSYQALHLEYWRERFLARQFFTPMCTMMHTRDCLERYGYWDETLPKGGDRELWERIVRQTPRIATAGAFTSFNFVSPARRGTAATQGGSYHWEECLQ